MPEFYRIAVATPLRRSFIYLPPKDPEVVIPTIGCRVLVPFGHQKLLGIVLGIESQLEQGLDPNKLKAIEDCFDTSPLLSESMLDFYLWAASYYQTGVGEALMQCLPALGRKKKPVSRETQTWWNLTQKGQQFDPASINRSAVKQRLLLEYLQQHRQINRETLNRLQITPSSCQSLAKRDLVTIEERIPEQTTGSTVTEHQFTLTSDQQIVFDGLKGHLNEFSCSLIEGVTGSGKTEVYISLIKAVLNEGKQVLILVPEIGLTPQTYNRIQQHIDHHVGLMHSGLTDRVRTNAWFDFSEGRTRVLLGTRSAIFVPMKEPGLIILDEEHDASYKQQDSFRYHARDLAIKRASLANIPVVLGSATPSLESLNNALTGKYHLYQLNQKAKAKHRLPVELVDLTRHQHHLGVSRPVLEKMQTHLDRGEQVLLFLNRRGFAPSLMCNQCGWVACCLHCDAKMTLHSKPAKMLCHHCNYQQPIPYQCPHCASRNLEALGQGTARTESFIQQQFDQYPVIRIDRDAAKSSQEFQKLLEPVHRNEACVLIGTQMLAKGHDFPGVTLVAVLDADSGLFSSDFRAAEKTSQLLTQVAGRAGRSDLAGHVMVQTWHPTHPVFEYLQFGGYGAFARDHLLPGRQQAQLPPIQSMAMIRADSKREHSALEFLQKVSHMLPETILQVGPYPAILSRRSGYYRFWLTVQHPNRRQLQSALSQIAQTIEAGSHTSNISWGIDVDPVDIG